jgi:lysophospholipase L1-like esterase
MIGINDVWRQFDMPRVTECHVYLDEYAATLEELVRTTLPTLKGLVLMTPYYMETNKEDAMRATMDRYGKVVKEIAMKYDTLFVDTQAVFDEMLKHCHSANIAWDRVHPNHSGHMALARAFLNTMGFQW